MAFTGDLEHLNVVDIIQLLHTARKSGTFSVRGSRGESRILFSNGYIVGASHLNNSVRIGTVLVKMKAISLKDLELALDVQRRAGKNRKPLIATLIELGRLSPKAAEKGLRKLIEMTVVELIGWDRGTFTLDTEDIKVTPECSYPIGEMEQTASLDAQMVLMDALRVFDERERDRKSGKEIASFEALFADVVPAARDAADTGGNTVVTADDLGLADIDHLERRIPQYVPVNEVFDPMEVHRQKIGEILSGFSAEEQEAFVSFLDRSTTGFNPFEGLSGRKARAQSIVLFSEDDLIKHAVMTICKREGVFVFATDSEEELERIISQCFLIETSPVVVFDPHRVIHQEAIPSLPRRIMERYPGIIAIHTSSPEDYAFMLRAYEDGMRAVFPKPSREEGREHFVDDTIRFLDAFKSYLKGIYYTQQREDELLGGIRDRATAFRNMPEPSSISLALLQSVAEIFERAVTFIVHPAELAGDKAFGIHPETDGGPVPAAELRIPLTLTSIFRDAVEKGQMFYGESADAALRDHLFAAIGAPLRPVVFLLPMKSRGKIMTLTYGDFGGKEVSPVPGDALEILAALAGLSVESAVCRKMLRKAARK